MKLWLIDDAGSSFFVELKGTDKELNDVKAWAVEHYGDRVNPYSRNRESELYGAPRPVKKPEILYTTIIFYNVRDVTHFKLIWG